MPNPYKRHKARWLILQGLYQLQLNDKNPTEIELESESSPIYRQADRDYFHATFQGIVNRQEELNAIITSINDSADAIIDPIMRSILYIGIYELQYCEDLDHPIIIKEAILLCKEFLHEESHVFANSILDQATQKIRPFAHTPAILETSEIAENAAIIEFPAPPEPLETPTTTETSAISETSETQQPPKRPKLHKLYGRV